MTWDAGYTAPVALYCVAGAQRTKEMLLLAARVLPCFYHQSYVLSERSERLHVQPCMQQNNTTHDDTTMILIKSFCAGIGSFARGTKAAKEQRNQQNEQQQQYSPKETFVESPDCVAQASLFYLTPFVLD